MDMPILVQLFLQFIQSKNIFRALLGAENTTEN